MLAGTCLLLSACEDPAPAGASRCVGAGGDAVAAIPGGTFAMGSDKAYPEEAPVRMESVGDFRLDVHEVTNRQFAEFVAATDYLTVAERVPEAALHPEIPPAALVPGSAVFIAPQKPGEAWWHFVPGANWRRPEGPGSSVAGREEHPVVHIAYEDALAYAAWAGGELPTETEWEYAARSGRDRATYEWGETPPDEGPVRANTWQGLFPVANTARDGYLGSSPVGCYPSNRFGLYDMTGNVWEWVASDAGPNLGIVKGGSFLCAESYCRRYRPSARQQQEKDFSASHIGFRVAYRR